MSQFAVWVLDRTSWSRCAVVFANSDDLDEKLQDELFKFCVIHARKFFEMLKEQLHEHGIAIVVVGYRDEQNKFKCSLCEQIHEVAIPLPRSVQVNIYRQY